MFMKDLFQENKKCLKNIFNESRRFKGLFQHLGDWLKIRKTELELSLPHTYLKHS